MDVKSAVLNYISVHLAHECTRLGIGGISPTVILLTLGRIMKTIFQGTTERELSGVELENAVQGFNAELAHFGASIGFQTFDTAHGMHSENFEILSDIPIDILTAVESIRTIGTKQQDVSVETFEPETFIVPFDKNERFIGRKKLLQTLHQMLCEEVESAWNHRVALHGMGGVGKTQVAIEYIYTNRKNYDRIYWIRADNQASILSGFQDIAVRTQCLSSLSIQNPDQKLVASLVLGWLRRQKNWLIVLDNLDDITIVQDYLPERGPDKHTLISTRNPDAHGIPARGLEIPILELNESIEMLCNLAEMDQETHQLSAKEVVKELQYLPLAIDQAASYVRSVTNDFTAFLIDYRLRRPELHKWVPQGNRQYSHSLATVWIVSLEFVEREMQIALKFLELFSFLNPDNISLDFLKEGQSAFEPEMEEMLADNLKFAEVLIGLERFSLVKWSKKQRTLSMHRLIQAVVKDKMEGRRRDFWASVVVKMCDIVTPKNLDNETRGQFRQHQTQVVVPLAGLGRYCPPAGVEIVFRVGDFMALEGKYTEGEKLVSLAILLLSGSSCKKDEVRTLKFAARLADIKRRLGRLQEAVALHKKALAGQINLVGRDHTDTLMTKHSLAVVYRNQGLLSEAAELCNEVLGDRMKILGKDHPDTLSTKHNLAIVYRNQGLLSEATELYNEVLGDRMKILGKDHPDTLRTKHNLALVYWNQGRLGDATELAEDELEARTRNLGTEHLLTCSSMASLGRIYKSAGRLIEAIRLLESALEVQMKTLGQDHLDTLESMVNIGAGYMEQGKLEGGIQIVKKVLEAPEHVLSKDHLCRFEAISVLGLGRFLEGRIDDALRIHTSAVTECERVFGPQHPLVLTLLSSLADELPSQDRWKEAVECQEKAVKGMTVTYGADHHFTTKASKKLEELRTNADGNTASIQSQHEVSPRTETALHITDDTCANSTGPPPIAEGTSTETSEIVSGEPVENLPSVPDHKPESPMELVVP